MIISKLIPRIEQLEKRIEKHKTLCPNTRQGRDGNAKALKECKAELIEREKQLDAYMRGEYPVDIKTTNG